MRNTEIIDRLPTIKSLEDEEKTLDRQLCELTLRLQQVRRDIRVLKQVTEVFEGVALEVRTDESQYGKRINVGLVAGDGRRQAQVYPNCKTKGADWGLELLDGSIGVYRCPGWQGVGWAFDDATLWARRWVAFGEIASQELQTMLKLRHQLDPKDKASECQRLAFEAAFTAGQVELAKGLLNGC